MSRQFKIFLSSSFQDMHEERDYLKYHAFAALQAELFQKGWDLQILDLRGTTTQPDLSQEEAVLRLCLDGVEECIPRMVVLLGDRYGWIPFGEGAKYPDEEARYRAETSVQNINDAPNLDITEDEISGRSVTHLEIYYGLKHMSHDDVFVYQRTGLPYEDMTDGQRAVFCSGYDAQQALKAEIRETMSDHIHNIKEYAAGWNYVAGKVNGLEALDAMIYSDLKASFDREVAAVSSEKTTWAAYSKDILTSLGKSTIRRNATGTPDPSPEFRDNLQETMEHPGFYWVTGERGSGVTTYMAQLCYSLMFVEIWREEHHEKPILLVKYIAESHFGDLTADIMLGQLVEQLEAPAVDICPEEERESLDSAIDASIAIQQDYWDNRDDLSKKEAVTRTLSGIIHRFLSLLHNAYDIFFILCDVDMLLENDDDFGTLYWLDDIPSNVTVVFSAAEGSLTPCMEHKFIYVPPLSAELIGEIMANTARDYGKRFSAEIIDLAIHKLLSTKYAKALHVRALSECLMNMTGPDYLAFTGPDAHLSFMKQLISEIPGNVDGVFDVVINRAKMAYGELAIAALRLLWVSRAAIPHWIFRDALSVNLGREVTELELFSLKGYLRGTLKDTRGLTWQLAHDSFRSALMMHIGDAVRDSAAAILQILRDNLSDHSFTLSEFIWYGYWAGDPAAVVEYFDSFCDNGAAWYEMLLLFNSKLRRNEGEWIIYMKRAIEPLRKNPDALTGVFFLLCIPVPGTQENYIVYDELLNSYLTASVDFVPQKAISELRQQYAAWRLKSKTIHEDVTKRREALCSLETTSLHAAGQFDPKKDGEAANWYSYMSDALYAQTLLCVNWLLKEPDYAKECFERAVVTFERLGDDGIRHLIEKGNVSLLTILGTYFYLNFMINGFVMSGLAEKLNSYVELLEKRSGDLELQVDMFRLYTVVVETLESNNVPQELRDNRSDTAADKEEAAYKYLKKLVHLGNELYPKKLKDSEFIRKYLKALLELAQEQLIRGYHDEASLTNQMYIQTILNLHENKRLSEEEVADSSVYKATEDYIKHGLNENPEDWRLMTDYLMEMAEWVDSCRPDPLRRSICHASVLLLKADYASTAEDSNEQEVDQFFREALELVLHIPDQFSECVSNGLDVKKRQDLVTDILSLLPNMFAELTKRDMVTDAELILEIFSRLYPELLDRSELLEEIKNIPVQISDEFKRTLKVQEQQGSSVSAEIAFTLVEIMEGYLEPHHKRLKKRLSAIRKALLKG